MRKILLALFLVIASCSLAFGEGMITIGKKKGGGAICTTSNDSSIFDYTGEAYGDALYIWGADQGLVIAAIQFTVAGAMTITEYLLNVISVTTEGTVTAAIYPDDGGSVGATAVSGTSKDLAISTTGVKTFTLASPKTGLSAGTYWLYFHMDTALGKINGQWRNWGLTHRVYGNGDYANTSGIEAGLYGCTE